MRIGIDVRMWAESGLGRYIRNLVKQLVLIESENEYVLFGLSKDAGEIKQIIASSTNWRFVEANYTWYGFAEQLLFPWKLYKERLDIVHFPHFNIPILYFRKFVVTIHDLTHSEFTMNRATTLHPLLYSIKHLAYSLVFDIAVRRSRSIICISQYVGKTLVDRFPFSKSKIWVTYEAGNDSSLVQVTPQEVPVPGPYFFYVGNVHPHKNIEFLLRAFAQFRNEHPEYYLVLSGRDNYFWQQLRKYADENQLDTHVIFTGFIQDAQLAYLYSHAVAFIFPSLSEGFGLPLLEAMAYSCPVLSSSTTSLPEIGGNAALYFDPKDEHSLVSQMELITQNGDERAAYIARGLEQVRKFRWARMAQETLQVYTS